MTKNRSSASVGDMKSPRLLATTSSLREASDQAYQISATKAGPVMTSAAKENMVQALKVAITQRGSPQTCKQRLWLSFFFDGTGNNLDADIELLKHSNIAKLYRAHQPKNPKEGILSVYVPGVGTYFPEIGDDGGSVAGMGFGAKGEDRINFALQQFDAFLVEPLARTSAPANAIEEINIAAFGFSRGAALARAFLNAIMEDRCNMRNGRWMLKSGSWPIRFRFLGIFDTVASVGIPMSFNNTGMYESYVGNLSNIIANRLSEYHETRPEALAFASGGAPGADPSPGIANGHDGWGGKLKVHESIEEVRHFVAAHEIRNSFPLDSVSSMTNGRISKPAHFYETIYPGAHSDVGGGYAPGEGAKSASPSESFSVIPLIHMYNYALGCGVPMLAEWKSDNIADFKVHPLLVQNYNHYLKIVGTFSSLGEGMNRHMELYYAWRFKVIKDRVSGGGSRADLVKHYNERFRAVENNISKKLAELDKKEAAAKISLQGMVALKEMGEQSLDDASSQAVVQVSDADIGKARRTYEAARNEHLKMKARKESLPNMSNFEATLSLYDRQLIADVQAIRGMLEKDVGGKKRKNLRPHYKALLQAYENEILHDRGLKDENVISLFENYIHESLAGFGKDASLPSDPRVIYLGGNEKYRYASLSPQVMEADDGKMMV